MIWSKLIVIISITITCFCITSESFSQTNRRLTILQLVENSVFNQKSIIGFNSPFYRYFEDFKIDSNSRIKLLDGTYSNVNEENVRSHLDYKISSTKRSGQYYIIDTLEQFFAFDRNKLQNLGFGKLNSVDPDSWIADISGKKFKINKTFYSIYFANHPNLPPSIVPSLGKYLMFEVYFARDSSLEMQVFETIQDSLLYNKIDTITSKKGSLITIKNQNVYVTEFTILVDDEGKQLQLQDIESSKKIEIDYFFHEYSKKNIALKVITLK